jgi:putative hemolysin
MKTELVVISVTLLVGSWLSSALHALADLSWGSIRKLDAQKKKDLIDQAETWMERRTRLRALVRLLSYINLAFMAVSFGTLIKDELPAYTKTELQLAGMLLVACAVFIILTEAIGGWASQWEWEILQFSVPMLRILGIVPGILIYPAIIAPLKLEELRESEDEEEKPTTEDEIEALLDHDDHSRDEEATNGMEKSTGQMIRGVLDLDETLVKEIMTPRVDMDAVAVSTSIPDVKKRIIESGHSRIPVYRDDVDDIIGIVYSKNLLDDEVVQEKSLEKLMHTPSYIPETKNVDDLLQEFKQKKVHIAVVIDEYGGTAGLVTLEDILEEIVGEIADEFDEAEEEEKPLQPDADGSLTLEARTPIDDVNDVLEISLPEEEDNVTIGGYVIGELGRIPRVGETFMFDEIEVKVLEADHRKVDRLLLRKLDQAEKETS